LRRDDPAALRAYREPAEREQLPVARDQKIGAAARGKD